MTRRPADSCPYERPFSDEFDGCPAYRRSRMLVVDMQYRSLGTINTCAHLDARSLPRGDAGYYAHCTIGDAAERAEWASRFADERLRRVRQLARELGETTRQVSQRMWEAKAEQLRATRAGADDRPARRRIRQAATAYENAARRFLDRERAELDELGISPEAVIELIRETVFDWALRTSAIESYRPSEQVLERFSPDVRAFLTPNVT